MRLLLTGVNHKTAPVEVRERLAFDQNSLPDALSRLKQCSGVLEGMILSTCNRVEVAVMLSDPTLPVSCVEEFLAENRRLEPRWIEPYLYHFEGKEAIRHIFRVAASLDSMVVGEPQILGQMKSAYALAKAQGAVTGFLDSVITRAFSVAKRVRSETEIGQNAVSVSFAAIELAREIFGSLKGKKVMLVGAGKMSELAARHLRRSGVTQIYVTNRTHERAVEMADIFQGVTVPYSGFKQTLPDVDIVLVSTGASDYVLSRDDMKRVIEARRNRPVFLIDIAVPRNIDPAVNKLDNIFLYDIDDLQKVVESNRHGRVKEAEQAEEIIDEEVERLVSRMKAREVVPMIVSLQEQLELIRVSEIDRLRGKLGTLTVQQEEALELITRGIMSKIAHGPISELRKHAGQPHGIHIVDVIRRVFRLGGQS